MTKAQAPASGDADAGLGSQGVGWGEESLPLQMFILVFILLNSLKTIRKNVPECWEINAFERTSPFLCLYYHVTSCAHLHKCETVGHPFYPHPAMIVSCLFPGLFSCEILQCKPK